MSVLHFPSHKCYLYRLTHKFHVLQFLSKDEYIKGIGVYESIIRALATHNDEARDEESRAELWDDLTLPWCNSCSSIGGLKSYLGKPADYLSAPTAKLKQWTRLHEPCTFSEKLNTLNNRYCSCGYFRIQVIAILSDGSLLHKRSTYALNLFC